MNSYVYIIVSFIYFFVYDNKIFVLRLVSVNILYLGCIKGEEVILILVYV